MSFVEGCSTCMMNIVPAATGLDEALAVLRDGGIVAHATETCYGFACDVRNRGAACNLFTLKRRPFTSPVSVLFASVDDAKRFVAWNDDAERLAAQHLPGPLTLILPLRTDAPAKLFTTPAGGDAGAAATIGVRVSSHPNAQALVTAFGSPLSTTSANLHGQPNCYSADEICAQYAGEAVQPDLILDAGLLPRVPPSTIIDLTDPARRVRRKGSVV